MKIKIFSCLLACMVICGTFVGCGDNDDDNDNNKNSVSDSADTGSKSDKNNSKEILTDAGWNVTEFEGLGFYAPADIHESTEGTGRWYYVGYNVEYGGEIFFVGKKTYDDITVKEDNMDYIISKVYEKEDGLVIVKDEPGYYIYVNNDSFADKSKSYIYVFVKNTGTCYAIRMKPFAWKGGTYRAYKDFDTEIKSNPGDYFTDEIYEAFIDTIKPLI